MFPVDAATLAKDYQRLVADAHAHASEGWSPSPVESWKDGLEVTAAAIRNFRGNWISGGTINAPDRPLRFPKVLAATDYKAESVKDRLLGQARLLRTSWKMYPHIDKAVWPDFAHLAQDDGFGGARRSWLPSIGMVSDASLRYALYAVKLRPLVGTGCSFFEVGGGFGGLCQRIFPDLHASRYMLTDLPVNMTLSYYNLASHFGEKVGRFWNVDDVSQLDRPILIVAPWLLDRLGFSLDVAINTVSFQHMSRTNLEYYGAAFERLRIGKVFHANRIVRRDPTDVLVDDYPFRQAYDVSIRRESWLSPDIVEELLVRKPG